MDSSGKAPLHVQLTDLLREQIRSGLFHPGDRLPTEKELMERHGLSSSTVRQAVMTLVREGLLYRKAGKGTFVAEPQLGRDLLTFAGYSEEAIAKGFQPGSRLVTVRWTVPPAAVAGALGVDPDVKVYEVERVRTVDDLVVALEAVYFPQSIGDLLARVTLEDASLTSLLEDRFGLRLARAHQVIRAAAATARVARLLEVHPRAALLQIDRTALFQDERVAYFSSSYYRGDRYAYEGWIERGQSLAGREPVLAGPASFRREP